MTELSFNSLVEQHGRSVYLAELADAWNKTRLHKAGSGMDGKVRVPGGAGKHRVGNSRLFALDCKSSSSSLTISTTMGSGVR